MPYLGRQVVTNLADFHVDNYAAGGGFTAGSTTQLTLTVAGIDDEEALSIFFDGVHQHHNTYTIASSVVTFDTAIPTGTANVEIHYGKQPVASALAANVIDSEHYVDGSIDLAHMSSQSVDEDNLHISNSGSNGQFLSKQSGDSGGLTWATISTTNDFEFISSGVASGSATLDFTGLDTSIYSSYRVVFAQMRAAGANYHLLMQTSTDGGSSYDTSGYVYTSHWRRSDSTESGQNGASVDGIILSVRTNTDTSVLDLISGEAILFLPNDTGYTFVMNHSTGWYTDNRYYILQGTGIRESAADVDAIRIKMNSGNITSGTVILYGMRKA